MSNEGTQPQHDSSSSAIELSRWMKARRSFDFSNERLFEPFRHLVEELLVRSAA